MRAGRRAHRKPRPAELVVTRGVKQRPRGLYGLAGVGRAGNSGDVKPNHLVTHQPVYKGIRVGQHVSRLTIEAVDQPAVIHRAHLLRQLSGPPHVREQDSHLDVHATGGPVFHSGIAKLRVLSRRNVS